MASRGIQYTKMCIQSFKQVTSSWFSCWGSVEVEVTESVLEVSEGNF